MSVSVSVTASATLIATAAALGAVVAQPRAGLADPPPGVTVRARARDLARRAVEDRPSFATSIDLSSRGAIAPSVGSVLAEAPSVHVRQTGDALAPTIVGLRGSPASQVSVALDGVLLNDPTSEGVDLSLVPAAILERADVYRGGAPTRFGSAGFGGAIDLVTRRTSAASFTTLTAGLGTQWQRRFSVIAGGGSDRVSALIAVAYRGTEGTYDYRDDRGTELTPDDDRIVPRGNNAANLFDLFFRACAGPTRVQVCGVLLGAIRERGMPGPAASAFTAANLAQRRWLARVSVRAQLGDVRVEPYASWTARADRFRDPAGELIAGRQIDTPSGGHAIEVGAVADGTWRALRVQPVVRVRRDDVDGSSIFSAARRASRWTLVAGADTRIRTGPVEWAPAFVVEALADTPDGGAPRWNVLPSPRMGARVRLHSWVDVRANYVHHERAASLPELLGIGGVVTPNPDLVPERSDGGDAGIVVDARSGSFELRAEAVAFGRFARDLIVLVRQDPIALKPFNLRAATLAGAEFALRLRMARFFGAQASYALTHAATVSPGSPVDGLRPPNIPAHDLFVRIEALELPLRPWTTLQFTSGIYFDEANARGAPPILRVDVGARAVLPQLPWLMLDAYVSNLFDSLAGVVDVQRGGTRYGITQPLADYAGFPLPGRTFFAQLTVLTGGAR